MPPPSNFRLFQSPLQTPQPSDINNLFVSEFPCQHTRPIICGLPVIRPESAISSNALSYFPRDSPVVFPKEAWQPFCWKPKWRCSVNTPRKQKTDVLQGTLALMVLKTLDVLGPLHGYGIARRIEQISGDLLAVNQGTLYPVLLKLEQEGAIASEWGASQNNRRARFYRQPTPTARTLRDQKLMPECKNLCLQNSASSETISQREEYGQHGLGRLPVATL